ncbi:response regulator transcription factor [Vibrio tubiashii]|uniref:Regulator n=1 Tax=Vibrio tubiashii ATCC 19109 TaxID=1051646 RepID=F9T233_9VIBR|nr:response regulator transcription factor [Vibrio tubiashii]AIW16473.1 regulator [Vibrio tubiashii ATCC 19109]EGU57940.1 fimbrial protein Z transcriptional regulator [Vibrio tubiashii ATCC 19109]EIF04878.1 two component transcriptional regulator [Vibrio tubiashii NCIMB 1337 = ATCC 19106]
MTRDTNVLVLDSQPIMREAISQFVYDGLAHSQVYQASTAVFGIQVLKTYDIDLVLLDVELEGSDGFEFLRRVRAHGYKGQVLFISNTDHPMYSDTARKLGANGYITKREDTPVIREAIIRVAGGYSVFKRKGLGQSERCTTLSNRETVVFNYLVKGYSNKKISEILSLSSKTISTYKSRILDKYKVDSIVELMNLQQHVYVDVSEVRTNAA